MEKIVPQNWVVELNAPADWDAAVDLIAQHSWPASGVLHERGAWDRQEHLFWNERQQMLWVGRYSSTPVISLQEMTERMKTLLSNE